MNVEQLHENLKYINKQKNLKLMELNTFLNENCKNKTIKKFLFDVFDNYEYISDVDKLLYQIIESEVYLLDIKSPIEPDSINCTSRNKRSIFFEFVGNDTCDISDSFKGELEIYFGDIDIVMDIKYI